MKNSTLFSRRLCVLVAGALAFCVMASARAGTTTSATWTGGGGGSNNWNTTTNWSGGNQPQGGTAATIITFAGNTSLAPNDDYGAFTLEGSILFASGASSFTLGGNAVKLAGKIENQGGNLQTYNQAGLTLEGGVAGAPTTNPELDPTSGDLTISTPGSSIFVDNNTAGTTTEVDVFGSHVLTLNGALKDGNGPGKLVIQGTATVVFNAANTYTGGTFINNGTLQFNSGGSASGTLTLGNNSGANNSTLAVGGTAGGVTVANAITERTGSSGTKTFSGLNTSGTNTFSGIVTLNDNLGQASSAGGTGVLNFSNQVTTGGSAQTLTITGGTVALSGAADNSNLAVTVNGGSTLNLNKASTSGIHAFGGSSTINSGGIMRITGTGGDQIFNSAGLTVNGTFDLNAQSETIDALNGTTGLVTNNASGTSTLTTGGNGGGGTYSGALQDGGGGKVLALTKSGAGTLTLSGATNTFSGGLNLNGGTLSSTVQGAIGSGGLSFNTGTLSIDTNAQTYSNNITLAGGGGSGGTLSATSANGTFNGSITNGGNRLIVTGANNITLGGAISGAGDVLKQGAGTLTLNADSSAAWAANNTGTNGTNTNTNLFVDNGTVQFGTSGAGGTTNGSTTGLIALGASNAGTAGNVSLLLTTAGTTLANPIDSRFFTGVSSAKTIGGTNTTGTVTYSGAITLHDNTSLVAANGGTVAFGGVIATGTAGSPYASEAVNTAAPTGGFGTGPGVIINSGASSTGIVEYDNAMTYAGDTVVNSGTLQFNGSGSLLNSTIRLGALGPATLNLISPTGSTLNVTVNVRSANSIISASNTSGTSTLGGHFALDANATVQEASSTGTLAITQTHTDGATAKTGTDIKGFTLTLTPTGTINISGDIYNSTGSGNILMNGSGLLVFSGATPNTYTGTTTVSSGELDLSKNDGAGPGGTNSAALAMGGNLTINGGTVKWLQSNQLATSASVILSSGTLNLNGQSQTVNDLNNSGGIFMTGAGTWTGTGASMTWGGGSSTVNTGGTVFENHLTITAGTNEIQAGGLVQLAMTGLTMNGGTVTIDAASGPNAAGKLALGSTVTAIDGTTSNILTSSPTNPGVVDLMGAPRTFQIGTTNATTTLNVSASITSSGGSILKTGAGSLVLTGNNTFTGATTVSGGTLNAGAVGALGATSSVTVNTGGTLLLSGSGNLNRVNDSAGISLGGGTFARTGSASEGTGARTVLGIPVSGTNTTGLGALTLTATSNLDFGTGVGTLVFASFAPAGHTLNILNYMNSNANSATNTSGIDGTDDRLIFDQDQSGNLASFNFGGGISAVEIALGGGYFEITAVPETSTWVMGALALSSLLIAQRKRVTRLVRRQRSAVS